MKDKHFKYVYDMTLGLQSLAQAINLKGTLETREDNEQTRPIPHHCRFELVLPGSENKMQYAIKAYTEEHAMVINKKNIKVMVFNEAIKYNFMPEIRKDIGKVLDVDEEFKLLGIIMTSDLK